MSAPAIIWPAEHTPGLTDNYTSNEVIIHGLTVDDIWPLLDVPSVWPTYYSNASNIRFAPDSPFQGPSFGGVNAVFFFDTFGLSVQSRVAERDEPAAKPGGTAGQKLARLAWVAWSGEKGTDSQMDVYHAWLLEDLDGDRVRILTQESQIGGPGKMLAAARPNPILNGHQAWLDGLVKTAQESKK